MDFVIPQSLKVYYQDRARELAPVVAAADVIVVAEPVGSAVADGVFELLRKRGLILPPTIRAEIGGPLWTRYLRIQNETLGQPGNPYYDPVGLTGYMPNDVKADFRTWLIQHCNLPEHAAPDVALHRLLQALAAVIRGIPERPVNLVVLAPEPFTEEDAEPYVLDAMSEVLAPERPILWQHNGIMTVGWMRDVVAAYPEWTEGSVIRSIYERASYDPQSLQLDERPQLDHLLAGLRSTLLEFS